MDQQSVAADWAARGFSCDLWVDPVGQCWNDFTHAADELVSVIEGDVEFEIEGEVFHPKPGEELLIPAGALHSVRNRGTTTSRWLYGYKSG
jgi:quercetin dioxygenase-like cupin family protein